eukprot:gene20947-27799_t
MSNGHFSVTLSVVTKFQQRCFECTGSTQGARHWVLVASPSLDHGSGNINFGNKKRQHDFWEPVSVVRLDEPASEASVKGMKGHVFQVMLNDLVSMATAPCSDNEGTDGGTDDDVMPRQSSSSSTGSSGDDEASGSGTSDYDDGPGDSHGQHKHQKRFSDDGEAEGMPGLGLGLGDVMGHARLAAASGPQTCTVHFAEWEVHTRGIASKLLAGMGYVSGNGLGASGSGISAPLEVTMLPSRRGLGGAEDLSKHGNGTKKKRKRKSRKQREAAERLAEKEGHRDEVHRQEMRGGAPGLFAFINNQLGEQSEAAAKMKPLEQSMLKDAPQDALLGGMP